MKQIIFLLAFSLFLNSCLQKDAKHTETVIENKDIDNIDQNFTIDTIQEAEQVINTSGEADPIGEIKKEYARINSLQLTPEKHSFICDTDGTITYHTASGKIPKISIDWGFVGHGSSTSEYYYKDDKLIFIYETYTGGPVNGPDKKTEYRTYINNDKTIRFMKDQEISNCTTCQFNQFSREYKTLKAYNTDNIKSSLCN